MTYLNSNEGRVEIPKPFYIELDPAKITGQYLEKALYDKDKAIPHPPYNSTDGKFHANQFDSYVAHHVTTNYRGGLVIYGDGDFAGASAKMPNTILRAEKLPNLPENTNHTIIPDRVAVCIAEMRNGTGDIYEGVSLALDLAKRGNNVTLVLPRDDITYKKTNAVLELLSDEIKASGMKIEDYHQAFDGPLFDLAIYPSTQRYNGTVPSKTTLLLRESGEPHPRAGISWQSDEWGGTTAYLNTGFNPEVDKYGAVGPIKHEIVKMQPQEIKLLEQIKRIKSGGQEVVIAYPGSNEETEAENFLHTYEQLLQNDWVKDGNKITVVIPGDTVIDTSKLSSDKIQIIQLGKVRNAFLQHLMKTEVSKRIPSLVAGSMSMVEAMSNGVPFFYKTELWKSGNSEVLAKTMKQVGLAPKKIEVTRSSGMLRGIDIEGSPVEILYFDQPKNGKEIGVLLSYLQHTANNCIGILPEAIIEWYGILRKIYDQGDPKLLQQLISKINKP